MAYLLLALSAGFIAFCVWLTVRIVNRKERWAKRTALALGIATFLYPLSIGPAVLVLDRAGYPKWVMEPYRQIYAPIHWLVVNGPQPIRDALEWYGDLWSGT
jgi:hypothetical protein